MIPKEKLKSLFYTLRGLCELIIETESSAWKKMGYDLEPESHGEIFRAFASLEKLFESNKWEIDKIFNNAANTMVNLEDGKPINITEFSEGIDFLRINKDEEIKLVEHAVYALERLVKINKTGIHEPYQYKKWSEDYVPP